MQQLDIHVDVDLGSLEQQLPSLVISVLALLFTTFSFWWINARRGRLKSFEPHSFAAAATSSTLLLRFPLVIHNTGAKPIVIQNLRLVLPGKRSPLTTVPWRTARSQLKPDGNDGHAFPAVFSVSGRSAPQYFLEFGHPLPGYKLEPRDYKVRIEVKLGDRLRWKRLLRFTLRASNISSPDQYITYSNAPQKLTRQEASAANALIKDLLKKLGSAKPTVGDDAEGRGRPPNTEGPQS